MKFSPETASKISFTLLLTSASFLSEASIIDSVGVKNEGGKTYVIYKVAPKQTLFSIVKKYGSSISEFKAANPGVSENIQIGQTIKIPYKGIVKASAAPKAAEPLESPLPPNPRADAPGIHVVEAHQGLYGIATKYKVTMAEIRKWNGLTTDQLHVGQTLIVSDRQYVLSRKAATTAKTETSTPAVNTAPVAEHPVATAPPVSVPKEEPKPVISAPKEEPKVAVKEEKIDEGSVNKTSETTKIASGYKKTFETGLAELIDVEDKSGKYLALHHSAPTGTLVNVKNQSNGQSIWVKVIGKLPDTGDKVIIKLSPRAFEKLSPADKRIRAEISYLVP
ncbi:LysM repeat-containing protein [Pseudarcicella hirudinis]|uniref:LysM repeat-containing protein n=1 Tax=Pseudarcicella hirudinis TaxID=1079859 RepID=A0A1I5PFT3_9BACT|nr:LysM peptidoglycan-binding domain-containing protein [Pseudarcicella hirudinis]SFP32346.1 LysM repeat-containing protein [Pseudarcicella hirudinis]